MQAAQFVIPLYVHDSNGEMPWQPGAASNWWLHHSLQCLDSTLHALGSKLIIRSGNSLSTLQQVIKETGATLVTWNRLYEPAARTRDTEIKKALRNSDIEVHSGNSALLFEPWTIHTKQQTPFKVFTPFWRACQMQLPQLTPPASAPNYISSPVNAPNSLALSDLKLLPSIHWYTGLQHRWNPGEQSALRQLQAFIDKAIDGYSNHRDQPAVNGTSSLSPCLHFGEISPRQIVAATNAAELTGSALQNAEVFLKEVGWREFAYHLLYHFPHTTEHSLDNRFNDFRWQENRSWLKA